MKIIFLSIAIIAVTFSINPIRAQRYNRGFQNCEVLNKKLNLTAEQEKKIEAINSEFSPKFESARAQVNSAEKQTQIQELRNQRHEAISKVLTTEQLSEFNKLNVDRQAPQSSRRDYGRRGYNRKNLNLTEEQKSKIESLNKEYLPKIQELEKKHNEELNKIYTPEQQATLKNGRYNNKYSLNKYSQRKDIRRANCLDSESRAKLNALQKDYRAQKRAITMSRIAPDAQKMKLDELNKKFRAEKRELFNKANKTVNNIG